MSSLTLNHFCVPGLGFEDAIEVATSAIGIARGGSTRASRKSKKSVTQMDSETLPEFHEDLVEVDSLRILRTNSPEWPYIVVGLLGSAVMGGAMPVYAILFGEVLGVLKLPTQGSKPIKKK